MASGDQSLSEYLTLKGELPYYDMQTWKYPLVQSLKNIAGKDLENHINEKVIGTFPFSGRRTFSLIQNKKRPLDTPEYLMKVNEFNKKIASSIATPYIRTLIRGSRES